MLDGGLTLDVTNITEATRLGERRKFLRIETHGRSNLNALAMANRSMRREIARSPIRWSL